MGGWLPSKPEELNSEQYLKFGSILSDCNKKFCKETERETEMSEGLLVTLKGLSQKGKTDWRDKIARGISE